MILVPSGDQSGLQSAAVFVVSRTWPLPSAFIDQISVSVPVQPVFEPRQKAIFWPSGEIDGSASTAALLVSRTWSEPSEFML